MAGAVSAKAVSALDSDMGLKTILRKRVAASKRRRAWISLIWRDFFLSTYFCRFLPIVLGTTLLCSCLPSHSDRIVVGSKNFTESLILGELIAQQIESTTSLKVERRFYLAGTYICQQAMLAGRIDIYPEYTGTALTAILKQGISRDKQDVYQRVKSEYERRLGLTLGPAFGFNDTSAMEIRGEDARRLDRKSVV